MITRQEILHRLQTIREDLFQRYPIHSLGLFGSSVRDEQTDKSDIDILVEFSESVGFEIVDLAIELETTLGHSVDLVSRKRIRDRFLFYMEKDLVYV